MPQHFFFRLSIALIFASSAFLSLARTQNQSIPVFMVSPGNLTTGNEYQLLIKNQHCMRNEFSNATVIAPPESGIKIINDVPINGCTIFAHIVVIRTPEHNKAILFVIKDEVRIGYIELNIKGDSPKPEPPSTTPSVDESKPKPAVRIPDDQPNKMSESSWLEVFPTSSLHLADATSQLSGNILWREGASYDGKVFGVRRLVNGTEVKALAVQGVVVIASLGRSGKHLAAVLYINNQGAQAFDLIPKKFELELTAPKAKILRYQDGESLARDIEKKAGREAFWMLLAGAFASQRQITTHSTTTGYFGGSFTLQDIMLNRIDGRYTGTYSGTTTTTTTYRDPRIIEMAVAGAQAAQYNGYELAKWVRNISLKANTIVPKGELAGVAFFEDEKKAKMAILRVPINGCVLEFAFTASER
jgi:hypothetical protein